MLKVVLDRGGADAVDYSSGTSLLTLYPISEVDHRPFILVLPGGGYHHLAQHEGEPVAQWLNSLGIHAGVLKYQTGSVEPASLIKDVEDALQWVRKTPKDWKVNPEQVGIMGFSAGGHLAAISAITGRVQPDLLLLGYPVITFEEPYAHKGSRQHFLGDSVSDEDIRSFSADQQVDNRTPPTFLWTTANDASVPVENSLLLAGALSKAGIPFELHIFEEGRHGLGLSPDNESCLQWLDLCANWLIKHHYVKKGTQ